MSDVKGEGGLSLKTIAVVFPLLVLAALAVFLAKEHFEEVARETLRADFGAVIDEDPDTGDLTVALENEEMADLVAVGEHIGKAGNVTVLDLTGCPSLVTTQGIEQVSKVESLIGIGMPALESLNGVKALPNLRELVMIECPQLTDISAVSGIYSLGALDLSGAISLTGEVELIGLPNLVDLTMSQCEGMEKLVLGDPGQLRTLFLDGCSGLKTITGLKFASSLTDIDLSNTHAMESVAGLEELPSLLLADLRNCAAADALLVIGQSGSIEILRLGGQTVKDLEPLAGLAKLREFHFDASSTMMSLNGLPTENLIYCGVAQCAALEDIGALADASVLQRVDFSGCTSLSDLSPLTGLRELKEVNLTGCRSVREVMVLHSTPALEIVQLGGTSVARQQLSALRKVFPEAVIDTSGR